MAPAMSRRLFPNTYRCTQMRPSEASNAAWWFTQWPESGLTRQTKCLALGRAETRHKMPTGAGPGRWPRPHCPLHVVAIGASPPLENLALATEVCPKTKVRNIRKFGPDFGGEVHAPDEHMQKHRGFRYQYLRDDFPVFGAGNWPRPPLARLREAPPLCPPPAQAPAATPTNRNCPAC